MRRFRCFPVMVLLFTACAPEEKHIATGAAAPEAPRVADAQGPSPATGCTQLASLTRDTLDLDHAVPHAQASLEEEQDGAGRLQTRIERHFNGIGTVVHERVEEFNEQSCPGLVTVRMFDDAAKPVWERLTVLDHQMPQVIFTYVPVVSATQTWSYSLSGLLLRHETDHGSNGTIDLQTLHTYDDSDCMLSRTITVPPGADDTNITGWLMGGHSLETWAYDVAGNLVTETHSYGRGEPTERTERTHDDFGQVLTERVTRGDEVLARMERTWAGNGRPMSMKTTKLGAHNVEQSWVYGNDGALLRREDTEDFNHDGVTDRRNVEHFNELGLVVMFEQDQPFDGVMDWRQRYAFDAAGRRIWEHALSIPDNRVTHETRWTFDDAGRELTEVLLQGGWPGQPHLKQTSHDALGRVVEIAYLADDGRLMRAEHTVYNPLGGVLLQSSDHNGDGTSDLNLAQTFDIAGNLLLTEKYSATDGVRLQRFLDYRPL